MGGRGISPDTKPSVLCVSSAGRRHLSPTLLFSFKSSPYGEKQLWAGEDLHPHSLAGTRS